MASSSSISNIPSSSELQTEEVRPQAGPLPSKRGEIGYDEELHRTGNATVSVEDAEPSLPARHPADRTPPDVSTLPTTPAPPSSDGATASVESIDGASSVHSSSKKSIISFFKPKIIPSYGGIRLTTLLLFILQLLVLGGTIAAWVIAAKILSRSTAKEVSSDNNDDNFGTTASSSIFIHVIFGIAFLGEVIFLERRVFRLRAERYAFLHPGEVLPTSRFHNSGSNISMGFAPWNRPPLPTYAATLAQSGYGTGDVEDNVIAAPPPPAYGNTRGSTLLLAGFLRNSLRAQRPASTHSTNSTPEDRPVSYLSRDEEWDATRDAERARVLENTLAVLEDGNVVNRRESQEARR